MVELADALPWRYGAHDVVGSALGVGVTGHQNKQCSNQRRESEWVRHGVESGRVTCREVSPESMVTWAEAFTYFSGPTKLRGSRLTVAHSL